MEKHLEIILSEITPQAIQENNETLNVTDELTYYGTSSGSASRDLRSFPDRLAET